MDLALLWLWHRPAATAPIRPLAWEPPCARSGALKRQKIQINKNKTASQAFSNEQLKSNKRANNLAMTNFKIPKQLVEIRKIKE